MSDTQDIPKLSKKAIQHIAIELQHGSDEDFRTFIDSYICYSHGFTNRNDKRNTDLYYRKGFMTERSLKQMQENIDNAKNINNGVTREHVVPISVHREQLNKIFEDNGNKNIEGMIAEYLDKNVLYCIVTKSYDSEDTMISKEYHSSMPNEWSRDENPWIRYEKSGLDLSSIKYIDSFELKKDLVTTQSFDNYIQLFSNSLKEISK